MDKETLHQAQSTLIHHAVTWLAQWSEQDGSHLLARVPAGDLQLLDGYRTLLAGHRQPTRAGDALESILARVQGPHGEAGETRYWPPQPLSLDEVPEPTAPPVIPVADRRALWQGFDAQARQLFDRFQQPRARFEAFTHLLHVWAWAVPCSYGEPGVSLYDEFRALGALLHALPGGVEPNSTLLLVGGDIPGIQDFVYTITSKGAAKGLRGRSFFIQLLGDAVVRRLLAELELPELNVVYAAGGNFMVLAPAGVEDRVDALARELNDGMLDAFEGDVALCLACQELPARDVGSGAFAAGASRDLKESLARQKRRRFADLAGKEWERVFAPQGQGGVDFCSVCQHETGRGEQAETIEGGGWKCERCRGFEELAEALAHDYPLLVIGERPVGKSAGWQTLLHDLTGMWYDFWPELHRPLAPPSRVYAVNEPRFLGELAHGLRLMANTTPKRDGGQVKTFEDLADDAMGIKRVGVLRMDVDDLGQVLTRRLPDRTLAGTSALSQALDRFFAGWLDAVCRDVGLKPGMEGVRPDRREVLYVIYAGGDDLFVVGSWDVIPLLAERVRDRFTAYAGGNPALHISAGITLEDRTFPLYQAADRADRALNHGAKELVREVGDRTVRKDAVTLLGTTVGWETFAEVSSIAQTLVVLTTRQGVPRSLLGTMRALHARYLLDVDSNRARDVAGDKVYFGPWRWRKAYQLARIGARYKREGQEGVAGQIQALERDVLVKERMPIIGLATRWAEYLTRGGDDR